MKKILSLIIEFACVASLFLACGQNADGSCNLAWSLSCLAVSVVCGVAYGKLNPEALKEGLNHEKTADDQKG